MKMGAGSTWIVAPEGGHVDVKEGQAGHFRDDGSDVLDPFLGSFGQLLFESSGFDQGVGTEREVLRFVHDVFERQGDSGIKRLVFNPKHHVEINLSTDSEDRFKQRSGDGVVPVEGFLIDGVIFFHESSIFGCGVFKEKTAHQKIFHFSATETFICCV